jgi:hypothetical protein
MLERKAALPELRRDSRASACTPGIPQNTNPLTPTNPAVGMNEGIETLDLPPQ